MAQLTNCWLGWDRARTHKGRKSNWQKNNVQSSLQLSASLIKNQWYHLCSRCIYFSTIHNGAFRSTVNMFLMHPVRAWYMWTRLGPPDSSSYILSDKSSHVNNWAKYFSHTLMTNYRSSTYFDFKSSYIVQSLAPPQVWSVFQFYYQSTDQSITCTTASLWLLYNIYRARTLRYH